VIDQIVQGSLETLSLKDLQEAWNGVPTTPWNVAYLDQDSPGNGTSDDPYAYARCDTDGSAVYESINTSATSMYVSPTGTNYPLWTTNASDFPFDIMVNGERMTVTSIASAYSPQNFSIIRAVNGILKVHHANEDVRLFIQPTLSM
jgi:hypothetical protein